MSDAHPDGVYAMHPTNQDKPDLAPSMQQAPKGSPRGPAQSVLSGQNAASSSSMMSLSRFSSTERVLVSNGRKFLVKNDATAILPS